MFCGCSQQYKTYLRTYIYTCHNTGAGLKSKPDESLPSELKHATIRLRSSVIIIQVKYGM